MSGWRNLNSQRSLDSFLFTDLVIFEVRAIVEFLNTVVTKRKNNNFLPGNPIGLDAQKNHRDKSCLPFDFLWPRKEGQWDAICSESFTVNAVVSTVYSFNE